MRRILFDNQVFSWQKVGGISRYFVELIQHLDSDIQVDLPLIYSNNIYLKHQNNKTLERFLSKDFFGRDRVINLLNTKKVEHFLKCGNFDIFHPTYFDPYFLKYLEERPFVLTIHDMIPENFPENFPNSEQLFANKKLLAHKANKIVSISGATKKEILKYYPDIDEQKIEIIYHGSNFTQNTDFSNINLKIPDNYILFVGQRGGYKNFERLLNAFRTVNSSFKDIFLVCAGSGFTNEELTLFKEFGLEDKIIHFFSSDNELQFLYHRAKCFVFPSLEEGFGLPILEAMATRCPIICSDIICFREIAEDAAFYFNPLSIESIASSIIQILEDNDVRNNLVRKGSLRINDFNWQKSADQLSMLYKSMIL